MARGQADRRHLGHHVCRGTVRERPGVMAFRFTKDYETPTQAAAAARHYGWLATHAKPLRQPALTAAGSTSLTFEFIDGRHARREDLLRLAELLGDAHGTAWTSELHRAQLDSPYTFRDVTRFEDFRSCRETALRKRLE